MAFRVSFRFVQQASKLGSWTENFWCDTNDRTVAITQANALRETLRRAKGDQCYCPSFRISEVGVFRSAEQILVFGAAPRPTTNFNADYPTTKILIELRSNTSKTVQWFGGVVDRWIAGGGNYQPIDDSPLDFNRLWTQLSAGTNAWSIRVLNPARPQFIVKAIDPATGTVTTNLNTLVNDSKVRIKGVRGLTQANAVWRISVINNTSFTLNGWVPTSTVMTKGDPTVRPQDYIFQKIARGRPVRATSHKVGKQPDQLSGRAKTRS